jgi:ribonuclease P protein component
MSADRPMPPAPARRTPEKPAGLPPWRRLRRTADFTRTERQGKRAQGAFLIVIAKPGRGRVGFTVSKKVGNAVCRNHVKRRLRDIARRHKERWLKQDLVVVARPESAWKELDELEADLLQTLEKLEKLEKLENSLRIDDNRGSHGKAKPPRS